ncbi:glycosyltransferase [Microbacterium sp.]|uniref:glycosyltransferase n=1 Tax=Microbacterium sp. TaxID=51671 RepID=UPI003A9339C4
MPRSLFVDSSGGDLELEKRVHPDVVVERVPVATPAFDSDIGMWPRMRARIPEVWAALDWRHDVIRFPERAYGRWRPALERAARDVHARRHVDLAIGTANPNVDFIPGAFLHGYDGVPYVMDYRDAWRLDVFSGRTLHGASSRVGRWERRLQRGAAEVWFVNDAIRQWHDTADPSIAAKTRVVANGYEEYDERLAVPVRTARERQLIFGYIGTMSAQVPLDALVAGWRLARKRDGRVAAARLIIHGYAGHFGTGEASMVAADDDSNGIHFAGPVSKATIGQVYAGFDALILALGSGRYVTSGKVYEYAATGIPVVSVHDPGNAATDVLADSPAWIGTRSLERVDVADAIIAGAALAVRQTDAQRVEAQRWASQYERSRQLDPRIDVLRGIVDVRQAA